MRKYYRKPYERVIPGLTVFLGFLLIAALIWIKYEEAKEIQRLKELANHQRIEQQEEEEFLRQKEATDSFYQKLEDGFDVNILVIGDSIGAGSGSSSESSKWTTLLAADLRRTYGVDVSITNISMGGNTSYAGYVRTMELNLAAGTQPEYDLAILCYGQNDALENFSLYYESIIRAVQTKFSRCSMISVLESSQRDYTEKMKTIQSICAHYNIPIADTIAPFTTTGEYNLTLTNDGVHPNDAGQRVYFETIRAVINENLGTAYTSENISPINPEITRFDHFLWLGTQYCGTLDGVIPNAAFERTDDLTYTLSCSSLEFSEISGMLGINYTYQSGDNKASIFVDGQEFSAPTVTFNYDFSQRHIIQVDDYCTVRDEIKVVFATKEQADGFLGMCFNNETGF